MTFAWQLQLLIAASLAAGCASMMSSSGTAAANLAPTAGNRAAGTVTFTPMGDRVRVVAKVTGLTQGMHGFHIHEKGDCSAADASSAGPHFNPTGSAHGRASAPAHHAGDMDNVVAGNDGTVPLDIHLAGVTLGGGAANDIADRALVVHAGADDYTSQPAGNSGARVACGVIKVVQ